MKKIIFTIGLSLFVGTVQGAGKFRVSVGLDYSTGDYGAADSTDIWSTSVGSRYKTGRWTFKGTLPYLHLTGPGSIAGPDGVPVPGATPGTATKHGLGDLQLSAAYLAYYDAAAKHGLSVKSKMKVPTASYSKRLGTGELDVSFQLDPFKVIGNTTLFGTLGRKYYGDPSGVEYRDVWYGRAGAMYKTSEKLEFGFSAGARQKVTATSDPRKDINLFVVKHLDKANKLQAYVLKGFSDSTADVGAGLLWMHAY